MRGRDSSIILKIQGIRFSLHRKQCQSKVRRTMIRSRLQTQDSLLKTQVKLNKAMSDKRTEFVLRKSENERGFHLSANKSRQVPERSKARLPLVELN